MTQPPIATVFVRDGSVYANSRDVAAYFEKRHDNVIRDIDSLVEGGVLNFEETPYLNPQNGQTYRSYEMDKDGFALLAMSFTGPKALKFKLAYVAAFNAMEQELRERDEDEDAKAISAMPEVEARKIVDLARKVHGLKQAQQLWFALGLPFVPLSLEHQPQSELVFTATLTAANQNGRYLAA